MRSLSRRLTLIVFMLIGGCPLPSSSASSAGTPDQALREQLHEIMKRMDEGMVMPPQGSVDADFVAMMVPHHQAAIDMALVQLRYTHNPQLIRICQEIIIEQQQEIAVMRGAIGALR